MPPTEVFLYRDAGGDVPLLDWLAGLPPKARARCIERLERLAALGHELRRPEADYLRDGIHELRVRVGTLNHRVLYAFVGRQLVMLSHGLVKEQAVPPIEIERAIERKRQYRKNPRLHRATETW